MAKRKVFYPVKMDEGLRKIIFSHYSRFLKPVGHNLRCIRIYCGLSADDLVSDLMTKYSFKTSKDGINLLETNKLNDYRPLSLYYLFYLAYYWDIDLVDLINKDFSIEANMPEHIKKMKKYKKSVVSAHLYNRNAVNMPFMESFLASFGVDYPNYCIPAKP